MGYWTQADLPFYYGLARTFPVADRWFCSCMGPTFPNRRFLRTTQRFFADAAAGALPAVSIVDPDFGAYSEENPQDVGLGEAFAAAVVNAVMTGPGWESTLLLWIYDEHGGYYDHVPPPEAVPPDDVPAHNWQLSLPSWLRAVLTPLFRKSLATLENADAGPATYDRYGFRVPAVIVSPYARRTSCSATCSTTPRY